VLPVPPPRALARAVMVLLAVDAALNMVSIALSMHALSLVSRLQASPRSVTRAAVLASDHNVALVTAVSLVGIIVTGVVFIAWLFKSVVFQEQTLHLGVGHSRKWAIGAWFVPFLNLRRPKNIVDAVWRGPSIIVNDGLAKPLTLCNFWWGTWLASNVLARLSTTGNANTLSGVHSNVVTSVLSDVMSIVSAVLAILVVRTIIRTQAEAEVVAREQRYGERAYLRMAPNQWQHIYPLPSDILNRQAGPLGQPTYGTALPADGHQPFAPPAGI